MAVILSPCPLIASGILEYLSSSTPVSDTFSRNSFQQTHLLSQLYYLVASCMKVLWPFSLTLPLL